MVTLLIIALAILGVPLFAIMLLSSMFVYREAGLEMTNVFISMTDLMTKPFLIPIPLFTIAGFLLANSSSPRRIIRFTEAWFGPIPGGLGMVAVLTLTGFTAFTGASGVTIVALGGLLMPILLQNGYPERKALGVLTSSGSLGLLYFPSLPVFILSTIYSLSSPDQPLSPDRVFLGGLVPGTLLVVFYAIYQYYLGKTIPSIKKHTFDKAKAIASFKPIIGELLLAPLILILLQSGVISLNDISLIILIYFFVLSVFIRRDVSLFKDMPKILFDSMSLVGAIAMILSVILGMNNYLIQEEIPQQILGVIEQYISSPAAFLFYLNIFLLIVGCLMDVFSATLAVLPLLIPLADKYGISPVHLSVIFLANLEIGYLTPPVGMNLFISSFQFKKPAVEIYKSVVPYIALLLVALGIITYIPAITESVPNAILGEQQSLHFNPITDLDPSAPEVAPGGDSDSGDLGGSDSGDLGGSGGAPAAEPDSGALE